MFCDIRDFARLSQKMEPRTLISILNDFYEAMGYVIDSAAARSTSSSAIASWPPSPTPTRRSRPRSR